jgi:hypothetical protein
MSDGNPSVLNARGQGFMFPNWALGLCLSAAILWILSIVWAVSVETETAGERIQIIYQVGLLSAGLIGLPLAVWRSVTAHKQAEAALGQLRATEAQLENTSRQIALAEAGVSADRLLKGAELIEHEKLAPRMAGVAILRDIAAAEGHQYQEEAIHLLCAFIRQKSRASREIFNSSGGIGDYDHLTRDDIVLAFQSINDIAREHPRGQYDLVDLFLNTRSLSGIDFSSLHTSSLMMAHVHFYSSEIIFKRFDEWISCRFIGGAVRFGSDAEDDVTIHNCLFRECAFRDKVNGKLLASSTIEQCEFTGAQVQGLPPMPPESGNWYWSDTPPEAPIEFVRSLQSRTRVDQHT